MKKFFQYWFLAFIFYLLQTQSVFAVNSLANWKSTVSLPYPLASHGSVSVNGNIFVIDGSAVTAQDHNDVIRALVGSSGYIDSWSLLSNKTLNALIWHAVASNDHFIYILGGHEENLGSSLSTIGTVSMGEVNASGDIATWSIQPSLPMPWANGWAEVKDNTLYYFGGYLPENRFLINQDIYKTSIDPVTDALGAWGSGGKLPEPLAFFGMAMSGNKVYLLGGYNGGVTNKAWQGEVDTDGNVGNWAPLPNLPQTLYKTHVGLLNGKILVA